MAPPSVIAEQAVRDFFNQWFAGLQPCLLLETHSNGAIFVSSRVTSGVPRQTGQAAWPHVHHKKRKANSSRLRRRERRAQARAEAAEQAAASPLSSAQKTPDVAEQATVATCPAVQAVATPGFPVQI